LPPIKLHEGRHSAASLARDASVDPEIRRQTLGHADAAMTSHYTHIEAQAHRAAAEAVAALVEGGRIVNGCSTRVLVHAPWGAARHDRAARKGHASSVVPVQRRVWDSNPRGRVNALAVFKTAAIGH
jgi:hypothetical protein